MFFALTLVRAGNFSTMINLDSYSYDELIQDEDK